MHVILTIKQQLAQLIAIILLIFNIANTYERARVNRDVSNYQIGNYEIVYYYIHLLAYYLNNVSSFKFLAK